MSLFTVRVSETKLWATDIAVQANKKAKKSGAFMVRVRFCWLNVHKSALFATV
jgi:hypothetical protein